LFPAECGGPRRQTAAPHGPGLGILDGERLDGTLRDTERRLPGARGGVYPTIPNAGHFLQEQPPDRLVEIILGLQDT
jgi:pimeloyl-ACP methyl ester carboxylesterase